MVIINDVGYVIIIVIKSNGGLIVDVFINIRYYGDYT